MAEKESALGAFVTHYERLSLLALAEIIEALVELRNPTLTSLGMKRYELLDEIREAAVTEEEPA